MRIGVAWEWVNQHIHLARVDLEDFMHIKEDAISKHWTKRLTFGQTNAPRTNDLLRVARQDPNNPKCVLGFCNSMLGWLEMLNIDISKACKYQIRTTMFVDTITTPYFNFSSTSTGHEEPLLGSQTNKPLQGHSAPTTQQIETMTLKTVKNRWWFLCSGIG